MAKMQFTKYGVAQDYRGAHATLSYHGRTLLGTIVNIWRDHIGYTRLTVRHFNGEPWPFEPCATSVNILDRDAAAIRKAR